MAGLPQPHTVWESDHNSVAAKLPLLFQRRLVRLVYYKHSNREEFRGRGRVSGWDEIAEWVGPSPSAGEWMSNTRAGTRFPTAAICPRGGGKQINSSNKVETSFFLGFPRAQGNQEAYCSLPARQACVCSLARMLNFTKAIWGVFWMLSLVLFCMCLGFKNEGTTLYSYRLNSGLKNSTKCI